MNLIKLFLPKENQQVVQELESYTVKWYVKQGWHNDNIVQFKVFVKKEEAKEFERQLNEQAKFIGCWLRSELYKN